MDQVYRFIQGILGPDDRPAEIHVRTRPFRLSVVTDGGAEVVVREKGPEGN